MGEDVAYERGNSTNGGNSKRFGIIIKVVLAVAVLAVGTGIAIYLLSGQQTVETTETSKVDDINNNNNKDVSTTPKTKKPPVTTTVKPTVLTPFVPPSDPKPKDGCKEDFDCDFITEKCSNKKCVCGVGYERKSEGAKCSDINECYKGYFYSKKEQCDEFYIRHSKTGNYLRIQGKNSHLGDDVNWGIELTKSETDGDLWVQKLISGSLIQIQSVNGQRYLGVDETGFVYTTKDGSKNTEQFFITPSGPNSQNQSLSSKNSNKQLAINDQGDIVAEAGSVTEGTWNFECRVEKINKCAKNQKCLNTEGSYDCVD